MIRPVVFLLLALLPFFYQPALAQAGAGEGEIENIREFFSLRKGFNLLGKFDVSWSNTGFKESEFKLVHDLGFNFVRLPLDFRTYTQYGNWDKFTETELVKIDKAVEWGIKYGVHVCINLHRAPGYGVNATTLPAGQQRDLWTDTVARAAFVNHWMMFAARYRDVPPVHLSFNLLNEPSGVEEEVYVEIMKEAIGAIHEVTPSRVVFVDGMNYARDIILPLKDEPFVAQALHAYDPFQLTHYRASWVNGSDSWPVPHWPMLWVNNYLFGPWKSEYKSPLVLKGNFAAGTEITVNVRQVSTESTLRIKAGASIIYSRKFVCGPELGDDFTQIVETQWGYQNISNKDYSVTLAAPAETLVFENATGDWMTLNSISLKQGETVTTWNLSDNSWGVKQSSYLVDESGTLKNSDGSSLLPFSHYMQNFELAREHNIPLMIQEFGVHNQTPHETAVSFLADLARLLHENNMGWALWNLSGSFGILNSSRADCTYETYQYNKLDRAMLDALMDPVSAAPVTAAAAGRLIVYPFPAREELFIRLENITGGAEAEVRDLSGRLLLQEHLPATPSSLHRIDVSQLPPGIFILSVRTTTQRYSRKILIQSKV